MKNSKKIVKLSEQQTTSEEINSTYSIDVKEPEITKDGYECKYNHIEGTPFALVENENECFGVLQDIRMTEIYKPEEKEKVIKELKTITWDKITAVIFKTYGLLKQQDEIKKLIENEQ